MQTLAEIKRILDSAGLRPKHALGQNFLVDHNLLRKLIDASGVAAGDLVLEVGPGTGTLTEELLARGCRVVACELDDSLAALLPARFASFGDRFTLVHGDCLAGKRDVAPAVIEALAIQSGGGGGGGGFSLVANLPYGAATPLMLALLVSHPACVHMAVTIQREVADRLVAGPGSKDYGTLGVVAAALAEVRVVARLPPECFWPRPEVQSAMVTVARRSEPLTADGAGLAAFCQRAFMHRRKQLGAVVAQVLGRGRAAGVVWPPGVAPTQRLEELSPALIIALAGAVADAAPGAVG